MLECVRRTPQWWPSIYPEILRRLLSLNSLAFVCSHNSFWLAELQSICFSSTDALAEKCHFTRKGICICAILWIEYPLLLTTSHQSAKHYGQCDRKFGGGRFTRRHIRRNHSLLFRHEMVHGRRDRWMYSGRRDGCYRRGICECRY